MAIASEGGNGSTTISVGASTYTTITAFTTPSSTDYIYKVTLSAVSPSNTTAIAFINPALLEGNSNSSSVDSLTTPCGLGTITVGPNTSVEIAALNSDTNSQDITIAYMYVGVKVS